MGGVELFAALEHENEELDKAVRRLKARGNIVFGGPARRDCCCRTLPPCQTERENSDFKYGGWNEKCVKCSRTVYLCERLAVDRFSVFHQALQTLCKCQQNLHCQRELDKGL